ncbi:MAG: aldo/keto reductase [Xenococcaceae cyanobacterium MO_167.B27]|nr:aldo/keto reductase [Xenococcaceae cyanobacterium MO_167.B27]
MEYRRFGQTNLNLSVFSLGTMRCLASPQLAQKTISKAIALGINHLETARGYGQSETYLGLTLKSNLSFPREQLYITTKLPPSPSPKQMESWIDESLTRLQIDYLDCLALHGVNTWQHLSWITDSSGCMSAIEKARQQGKIRHLGFSTHGSLDLIIAAINSDLFDFVNLHYYYFRQHNQPAIALAAAKDMGIFIISPADKGGKLYSPPQKILDLCAPISPLELTYRFLLHNPAITTLSVGAANPDELEFLQNIRQKNWDETFTPEETAIFTRLENHLTSSLESDRCSQCYQCLPCPETINIPEILRLRNLAVAYDMTDYGQYRYRMLENAGHWFPGNKGDHCTECGDCLPRCPEKLDIPKLLQDAHHRLNGSPRRRLWE